AQFTFHVPPRQLRGNTVFQFQQQRTTYGQNSSINRIMRHANEYSGDLFNISKERLKLELKKLRHLNT
ncbi:unnamed protein product, partial [Callosobruchus maculatus]